MDVLRARKPVATDFEYEDGLRRRVLPCDKISFNIPSFSRERESAPSAKP